MKAIVCRAFGPLRDLAYEDVPNPTLGAGQVRVRVRVASVGFMDALMVKGLYQLKPELPYVPGACGAGDVIEVGADVRAVKVGDRVSFLNYFGAFAEEIATDAHTVAVLPPEMDFEQAATARLSYSPAYLALVRRANLRAGETLLVTGASGGVGLAAIRLGKRLGARVIAVVGSGGKRAAVHASGADASVDHSVEDLRARVLALTEGRGADVVLDVVGGDVFDAAIRCVAREGRIVVMGFTSGRIPEVKVNRLLLKNASLLGVWLGDFMTHDPEGFRVMNEELLALTGAGGLTAVIADRFALPDVVPGMERLLSRETVGKIVITVP